MALRVGTNLDALNALRNLDIASTKQNGNVGRLSSGLRIQSAADDPSGLVMSEGLRAQIATLKGAQQTLTRADNILSTAEAGLASVSDLLGQIKESISKAQGDSSAVAAEQGSIDAALASIDSLGANTAFGSMKLFNSSQSIPVTSKVGVNDVRVTSLNLGGQASRAFTVDVTQRGSAASFNVGGITITNTLSTKFRITTNAGSVDVTLTGSAATIGGYFVASRFASAANSIGVYASGAYVYTRGFGSDERLSISAVSGSANITANLQIFSGTAINQATVFSSTSDGVSSTASGTNFEGTVGGISAGGTGTALVVNSSMLTASIEMDMSLSNLTANAGLSFTVTKGGMDFVIGTTAADKVNLAFPSITVDTLGTKSFTLGNETTGGFLSSLRSGGTTALSTGNFTNAARVVDSALNQILVARTALGGIQANTLTPRASQVGVEINNLSAVESSIREVDFASEITDFTKNQVLFQAATSVLAAANANQATVLSLLSGI